ncbi:hypothetical protein ABE504_29295, partial [Paenibacillus oryzisoli]|uniref:hypothetical protein n=1 Tax=Paenibacillus oryzisoli TaxID=1850517 RepID=UPI003D2D2A5A
KRIFHPLCLLYAFFLLAHKNKRHRAFSHAVSDSIFNPSLVFKRNLMTLRLGAAFFALWGGGKSFRNVTDARVGVVRRLIPVPAWTEPAFSTGN